MSDIMKLLDGISDLEREINDHAKHIRLNIVTELLRNPEFGYSTEKIISDAARIARFVEHGSSSERDAGNVRVTKVYKAPDKPKGKRPYVKRSKFWKK